MTQRYPALGALPNEAGVRFRVWAPGARRVEMIVEPERSAYVMSPLSENHFEAFVPGLKEGTLYWYRLNGEAHLYPDPASRFQSSGVHGPSMVINPWSYQWHDAEWTGHRQEDLVFYELHVGAFTPEGTFAAARRHLQYLKDVGVTAIELMPLADFPGRWNWGYDTAALFAPSRAYGSPDELRGLVDEAHQVSLAVFLDVVYNHLGPDGAYAPIFCPAYFSEKHSTLWGRAMNLDGEGASGVRAFLIENALHWLWEYHFDGLRLDAIHAIFDESPTHFLLELAQTLQNLPSPKRYLIAEDHRNLNRVVLPIEVGGYGLDAVWSDDFHHQLRRILVGDRDGYFADFTDSTRDLATVLRQGWLYTGQYARYFNEPRGTDPQGIPPTRFVFYVQNHDQVGNRPQGDRLSATIPLPMYRAAIALLLFAPQLPLIFMGQEWAASTAFCYFTDHNPDLGKLVTEGRRKEFAHFLRACTEMPDPQDARTFCQSKLDWGEADQPPHAEILRLHRDLLALRQSLKGPFSAEAPVEGGLVLRRGRHMLLVALKPNLALPYAQEAHVIWHTEAPAYAHDPDPPRLMGQVLHFPRPAALLARLP